MMSGIPVVFRGIPSCLEGVPEAFGLGVPEANASGAVLEGFFKAFSVVGY